MNEAAQPSTTAAATSTRRIATAALWVALAVALVSRAAYLEAKPFWRDEAWVALLVNQPWAELREGRPVPAGFLLLTGVADALPGLAPEVKLRLVPLLCGLLTLPVLGRLGGALGAGPLTAMAAVWLGVGLTPMIYYSRELKPYAIDVLLAVLVPLLALRGFGAPRPSVAARRGLIVCLVVAPWLTYGAVFPILAVLSWGWLVWWRRADGTARRDWLVVNAGFALSFGVAYVVILSAQAGDEQVHHYWSRLLFADSGLSFPRRVVVATETFFSASFQYFFITRWRIFALLATIGALTWPKRHRAFLLWLYFVSAALAVSAAVVDRYLVTNGRFLLFSAPVLLLWTAHGLTYLAQRLRVPTAPHVALAICIVFGTYWAHHTIRMRVEPRPTVLFRYDVLQDVDAIIAQATRLVAPDEPVLISAYAGNAFQFYARGRLPGARYCERECVRFGALTKAWLANIRDRGWLILVDDEVGRFGHYLDSLGLIRHQRGAARGAFLWEVSPRRRPSAPAGS